jgi:hypothetical protein
MEAGETRRFSERAWDQCPHEGIARGNPAPRLVFDGFAAWKNMWSTSREAISVAAAAVGPERSQKARVKNANAM